ncbi:hypothetical protein GGS26DRAFT_602249 [Hypomontagnella submonticulosa]|nr:hypothetical protein GGS26DRAFT_602249 [Hypomontagnella submonticulosa]
MSASRADLGLSCPSKGQFYVCDKAEVRFIGCCTVDPCADGSGKCPQESLAAASFSSDHYDSIPPQNCAPPRNSSQWFTCKSAQPFMGCCDINPCANSGCPTKSLLPAVLSDNDDDAQVFISGPSSTASATPTPAPSSSSTTLPLGGILGIALGGAAVVAIILVILAYRSGWLARRRKHEKDINESTTHYSGPGPYSPVMAQWQDGTQSGAPSPGYQNTGFAPYSPEQHHPQPMHSPGSSQSWYPDNRHVSQVSGMSGWNSVAGDTKHQSYSAPLLNQTATELEGRDTERPAIAELPTSPTNHR